MPDPPDALERTRWTDLIEASAAAGERLVALARRIDDGPWHMRALVGFADPIRPGIADAMSTARRAGIQVVVVTGDHPRTAATIAREAGLDADTVVTGEDLASWDDARLAAELPNLHVVARSTPEQKLRLVRAARTDHRIVAVTGDGVNDAPALHGADVAVAMGSGTAVAREASDLVLGDDSFATLMYGLAEGRRIVDNVQKGLVFIVSTHVAFLGFILISTIFVAERQVLLPLQILWMELFIDLSTSIAFEREPPEPELDDAATAPRRAAAADQRDPGRHRRGGRVHRRRHPGRDAHPRGQLPARGLARLHHARGGPVRPGVLEPKRPGADPPARQERVPLRRRGSLAVAIQVLIPYVPLLADAFRATTLDLSDWLLVVVVAFAPALLAEIARTRGRGTAIWVA